MSPTKKKDTISLDKNGFSFRLERKQAKNCFSVVFNTRYKYKFICYNILSFPFNINRYWWRGKLKYKRLYSIDFSFPIPK